MWRKEPSFTAGGNQIGAAALSLHQWIFAALFTVLNGNYFPLYLLIKIL